MVEWLPNKIGFGYYFAVVTTEKDFKKQLKKVNVKYDTDWLSAHAKTHSFRSGTGKGSSIVTFDANDPDNIKRLKDNPLGIVGLAVHEATHVKQDLLRFIGEHNPSVEFEAYLMQHISEEIIGSIGKALHRASKRKSLGVGKPVKLTI